MPTPGRFVTVARAGDIPPGAARQVTVDGRWVALFHIDGAYHAVEHHCLHLAGQPYEGPLGGHIVTCPWHGWQYDVRNGALIQDPTVGVSKHETRVVGDDIQIRIID